MKYLITGIGKGTYGNAGTPLGAGNLFQIEERPVAGEATPGYVVTSVSGVPTWAANTGGIGGLTANKLTKATSATTIGNSGITEESTVSYLYGARTGVATPSPLKLSLGGTFGNNAVGSPNNLKLILYEDGTPANTFGIGVSSGTMEFRVSSGGKALFTNNMFVAIGTVTTPAYQLHIAKNTAGTSVGARAGLLVEQQSSGGLGGIFLKNNLGTEAGFTITGSNYFTNSNNQVGLFTSGQEFALDCNGNTASGATGKIHMRLSGFNAARDFEFSNHGTLLMRSLDLNKVAHLRFYNGSQPDGLANKQAWTVNSGIGLVLIANDGVSSGGAETIEFRAGGYGSAALVQTLNKDGVIFHKGSVEIIGIPTAAPVGTGKLWSDAGTIKIT